ncbi:unnamed protein product [Gadus morhua 'NCC']
MSSSLSRAQCKILLDVNHTEQSESIMRHVSDGNHIIAEAAADDILIIIIIIIIITDIFSDIHAGRTRGNPAARSQLYLRTAYTKQPCYLRSLNSVMGPTSTPWRRWGWGAHPPMGLCRLPIVCPSGAHPPDAGSTLLTRGPDSSAPGDPAEPAG